MKRYSIVFDNKCAACSFGVQTFKSFGLMNDEQVIKLDQFQDNVLACNVNPIRACDEMAIINNYSLEVSYGYEGYVKIISVNHKHLGTIMSLRLVKFVMNTFYIFLASNRRVIAPIQPSDSTCTPTLRKSYRLTFIFLMSLFAGIITFVKGEIFHEYEWSDFLTGWKLITVTGVGWLLVGVSYKKSKRWEYWGHLAMIAGTAILLQTIGLIGYYISSSILWVLVSMGFSDLVMVWMHYRRVKIMGVSQKQTFIWWLTLHLTASVLLLGFNFLKI